MNYFFVSYELVKQLARKASSYKVQLLCNKALWRSSLHEMYVKVELPFTENGLDRFL